MLGLILLQTTSEELACPREDLSVSRKEELRKLLLVQVPETLCILNGGLVYTYDHLVILVTLKFYRTQISKPRNDFIIKAQMCN